MKNALYKFGVVLPAKYGTHFVLWLAKVALHRFKEREITFLPAEPRRWRRTVDPTRRSRPEPPIDVDAQVL